MAVRNFTPGRNPACGPKKRETRVLRAAGRLLVRDTSGTRKGVGSHIKSLLRPLVATANQNQNKMTDGRPSDPTIHRDGS
jgi:hypothetical protein